MKISSKSEFHSLVSSLRSHLSEENIPIKTTRAQELLAHSLGYKSANGLYSGLPVDIPLTETVISTFRDLLKKRHNAEINDASRLLSSLVTDHQSYSSVVKRDPRYCPDKLLPNENYWYLTKDGWAPWSQMDFTKMQVELNIYGVVHSHFAPFLDEDSFTGSARPVWTADIGSYEFECEAATLIAKFGEMPERARMFTRS